MAIGKSIKEKEQKKLLKLLEKRGFQIGKGIGEFGRAGVRQEEPFSTEQIALKSMFGGGEKIWGTQMQPVKMFHDLNPRQRGDNSTAELFGFG